MRGGKRKQKKSNRDYLVDFAVFTSSALLVILLFWLLRPKLMQLAIEVYSKSSQSSGDEYYQDYSGSETGIE